MRVILLAKKLMFFELPDKVNGSYWMPFGEDSDERLINIEADNDRWVMKENEETKIQNGNMLVSEVVLELHKFYILVRAGERLVIYTEETFDDSFRCFALPQSYRIMIGNGSGCDINYNIQYLDGQVAGITFDGTTRAITKTKDILLYKNNTILTENAATLQNGDSLFVYGLKIVIVNNILMINNPNNNLTVSSNFGVLPPVTSDELLLSEVKEVALYGENDYYLKSPRLNNVIEGKDMELSSPPQSANVDDPPFIFSIGPSLATASVALVNLSDLLSDYFAGETDMDEILPKVITMVLMLTASFMWPLLTKINTRSRRNNKEKNRVEKYNAYLDKKTEEIQNEIKNEEFILNDMFPSYKEALQIIGSKNRRLWERKSEQKDFLQVRVGVGDIPSYISMNTEEVEFTLQEDVLFTNFNNVIESSKTLHSVPVTYSFYDNRITAIMGNNMNKEYLFLKSIIVQFMAYHSYDELKFVVLADKKNIDFWEDFKNMPYCFSDDKKTRYFASNSEDRYELNKLLLEELKRRDEEISSKKETEIKKFQQFVVLTDNVQEALKLDFFNYILDADEQLCCSIIMIEDKLSQLPSRCVDFISLNSGVSDVYKIETDNNYHQVFKDELDVDVDLGKCATILSNIPIKYSVSNRYLPSSIAFLEMFGVGKVEQLNLLSRWKQNNPIKSIKAQIGVNDLQEPLYLDLHEKAHGPHGLIAGTTGSGKSEFIISYILSMAINYSPEEVSFILIDYKGGGLVGAFANEKTGLSLPHLAGKITNLDKAEMNRTLVSIDAELRRRQKVFNEARDSLGESTIDIYKYQRLYREGKLTEPVSHLFLIADEFAELKAQQPEFMDNLISTARIGRSLGVHLILATQKPNGVVNDQIWSNTKFRVCLKVQDRNDSNEMIKCPDAAEIKQAGRFYLQVGNNEIFVLGQSGWAGAPYYPNEYLKKEYDRSVVFINDIGETIESATDDTNKKVEVAQGDELTSIVKYIIETADKEKLKAKKMWLEKIPPIIYVNNLINKYIKKIDKEHMVAIVGEMDDPNNQLQDILTIPISDNGNSIFYSINGADKENAIKSLVYSTSCLYSNTDVCWYIVDYGSESLRMFNKLPHVADMVFQGESEKLNNLFKMILEEIEIRKKKFVNYSGSYQQFIKQSGEKLPLIGVVLNEYDTMVEEDAYFQDNMAQYVRDCERYGIFFIITAQSYSSVRGKVKQSFNNIMALEMNSKDDYTNIVGNWKKVCLFDFPGRGLVKKNEIFEFQTASIFPEDNFQTLLDAYIEKCRKKNPTKSKRIPILPEVISMGMLKDEIKGLEFIPMGMSKSTLQTIGLDLKNTPSYIFASSELSSTKNTIKFVTTEIKSTKLAKFFVLDPNEAFKDFSDMFDYYNTKDFDKLDADIQEFNEANKKANLNTIFILAEPGKLKVKADTKILDEMSKYIKANDNIKSLFACSSQSKSMDFDKWYGNLVNKQTGYWIGDGVMNQDIVRIGSLDKTMRQTIDDRFAWRVVNANASLIKLIDSEAGDEDE